MKLNCGQKVWDELCHYKTFLRVDWEGRLCQRRVTRIFLVNNKYFSIRLFLFQTNSKFYHRATTFYHRLPEKSCSFNHIFHLTTNMLTHQILRRRIKLEFTCKKLHMLLIYRKFNQLIYIFFLDKCKFISRLFKMLKSRNFNIRLISSSFLWYGDSTADSAHC